jgi:hypothetical protein
MSHPFSIRLSGQLASDVEARSDQVPERPSVMRRDLGRFYEALRRSMPPFTEAEATLLVNALNGTRHSDPASIALLWAEVADDDPALADRLRKLSFIECAAIVDAVERFWQGPYHQDGAIASRLREVGLTR